MVILEGSDDEVDKEANLKKVEERKVLLGKTLLNIRRMAWIMKVFKKKVYNIRLRLHQRK
jgi:hypothetical protein